MMKRIFIAGNEGKKGCKEAVEKLKKILESKAMIVGVDLSRHIKIPDEKIDLVISLGGDGSLLNLVESVVEKSLPVMGINFGKLGFLTAGLAHELEKLMNAYLNNETTIFEREVLEIRFDSEEGVVHRIALNDVVIASPDLSRVTSLHVVVSEEPLFCLRGDGLIISTPTGSTAHSLSAGGSLADPRVNALLLTPLSPQSLSSRPLIVRPDAHIEVRVENDHYKANILCDGQHIGLLAKNKRLHVDTSDKKIKLVQPKDFRFLQRLSEKLGWIKSF